MLHRFPRLKLLALSAPLLGVLPFVANAEDSTYSQLLNSFSKTGGAAGYPQSGDAPATQFGPAWLAYVNGLIILMATMLLVRIIYGGWLWFFARGKEEQVERAKSMIINAVIAIGVVLGARLIVELVLNLVGPLIVK